MKRFIILMTALLAYEFTNPPAPIQDMVERTQAERTAFQKFLQTNYIVGTYKVDESLAQEIVELTHKYGNDTFPQAKDLLAIIGIESSFCPHVKSKLKRDKAVGLTQIRPNVWKHLIKPGELTSIENQIKYSKIILTRYYEVLGDTQAAVNAYNVGITAHKRGDRNNTYVERFNAFKKLI